MTCGDLRRLVAENEGSGLDSPEAQAHLATCVTCRSMVERWHGALAEVRGWAREAPPPFLHGRLMAHVRSEGARAAKGRRRLAWWAPALAATFVAVVGGLALWRVPSLREPPGRGLAPALAPEKEKASPASALPPSSDALARASAPAEAELQGAPATHAISSLDERRVETSNEVSRQERARSQAVPQQAAPSRQDVPTSDTGGASPATREEVQSRVPPPPSAAAAAFAPEPKVAGGAGGVETLGEAEAAKPQAPSALGALPPEGGADEGRATGRLEAQDQSSSPAPALRAHAATESETGRAAVVCLLTGAGDRVQPVRVALAPDLAPPPGLTWTFVVTSTGEAQAGPTQRLADKEVRDVDASSVRRTRAIPRAALAALSRLSLAPGAYSLRRAPQAP